MGRILKKLIIILIMIIIFIATLFFIFNHKNNQSTKKIKEKIKVEEKENTKEKTNKEKEDNKEESNTDTSSNTNSTDSTSNTQNSDNSSSNQQNNSSSNNPNYNQNYNQVEDNYISVTKYNAKIKNNRLYVGDTTTITTVITPSNATDQEVTYTSSDLSVAIVSKTGVVTAINPGECYITISVKNVPNTGKLKVTVLSKNNTIYNDLQNND